MRKLIKIRISALYKSLKELFDILKNEEYKPQIVKDGRREDVLPLDLVKYEGFEKTYYENFNEACDEFYSKRVNNDIKDIKEKAWNKKVNKFEKRLRLQEETLDNFNKTIETSQHKGELIYSNYTGIENLINVVNSAISKEYSFKEIGKILKKAKKDGMDEAQIFESIDKMGVLTLNIDNTSILIDPKLSIPENAESYYEKAKKAKKKTKGALIAIENTKKQLEEIKSKKELAMENISIPKKREKKNLKWYEKLRWFVTSDNTLVVGGRDAGTNEAIVKKYLDNNDIYLHADIHGASSTAIKLEGKSLNDTILKESGEFAASFSSAWSKGFTTQDVFWVHPDQVSKTYVVLKPGYTKKEAIAKKILHKINEEDLITLDDIIRVLPSGKCDIDEEYHQRKKYEQN